LNKKQDLKPIPNLPIALNLKTAAGEPQPNISIIHTYLPVALNFKAAVGNPQTNISLPNYL